MTRAVRVTRPVADRARASAFHQAALGFGCDGDGLLRLGGQAVALLPGPPNQRGGASNDLAFQHLAIVVRDMDAAYAQLCRVAGWRPISMDGPQLLPPANGAVRAFKFRDPDENPLELIWFPPGQGRAVWHAPSAALFLGIDHSALAVAATAPSLAFYRGLGFHVAGQTLNHGAAQSRLDGLPDARAQVTSLRPDAPDSLGLELLAYQPPGRPADPHRRADVITLAIAGAAASMLRDPDGHHFEIVPTTAEEASG